MREQLSSQTVRDYLVGRGVFTRADGLEVEELAGGVACMVFAVRGEDKRVVVKQALERFRVADEWLVPPERAMTEARALELMAQLAPGSVPPLLDSDPEAFALVVEEAPADWQPWKSLLLAGEADPAVAAWLGALLAVLHSADGDIGSAGSFEAQRIDPYLRTIQRRHAELAGRIGEYIERLVDTTCCVVHGDYSPKNVLVGHDGLWVIDWEVAHRGDPTFDLAFLLNHLMLKTIHLPQVGSGYETCGRAFLEAYGQEVDLEYLLGLVGCLMLARVDGKSPAEYLTDTDREHARAAGIALFSDPPGSLAEAWAGLPP